MRYALFGTYTPNSALLAFGTIRWNTYTVCRGIHVCQKSGPTRKKNPTYVSDRVGRIRFRSNISKKEKGMFTIHYKIVHFVHIFLAFMRSCLVSTRTKVSIKIGNTLSVKYNAASSCSSSSRLI